MFILCIRNLFLKRNRQKAARKMLEKLTKKGERKNMRVHRKGERARRQLGNNSSSSQEAVLRVT